MNVVLRGPDFLTLALMNWHGKSADRSTP
jgi:hypothetical protein